MVHAHPPIISHTRTRAADWASVIDSTTSTMQLSTVIVMIYRIITQGTTEGQELLPHILDWISSVVTLYLGLLSQMTPITKFGVAAASLAVIVHSVYIIVYVWYSPQHRGLALFYFIFAMGVVGTIIVTSLRYLRGMTRVMIVTSISGFISLVVMVPAARDLVRALRHHQMDRLTAVDACLAVLNAAAVVVTGLLQKIVMFPHMIRAGLGILQVVVYIYTTIRAGPSEQDAEAQQGGGEVEMTGLPPPSPTSSSSSTGSPPPSSSPSSSTRSPPPSSLPVPRSPDYPQRVVQLQPPPGPPFTVIFTLCVVVLACIRHYLARIGLS